MALLVCAYQRVGRVSVLDLLFTVLAPFNFPGTGGGVFWGFSTIGGGGFSGYMPAGREGKRTAPFSFALPPSKLKGHRWISTLGGGAFGICMPACREGERTELCFRACAVSFSRTEGP